MGYNAILIKDATSGFTDSNYAAMLDILPLYCKLITAAEFTLEAPYASTARSATLPVSGNSFTERVAGSFAHDGVLLRVIRDKTGLPRPRYWRLP